MTLFLTLTHSKLLEEKDKYKTYVKFKIIKDTYDFELYTFCLFVCLLLLSGALLFI